MANTTYNNDYSNRSIHGGSFTDGDVLVDTHVNFNLDDLALATKYQAELEAQTTEQTIKSNIAIAKAQILSKKEELKQELATNQKLLDFAKNTAFIGGIVAILYLAKKEKEKKK
jgi:hypothetical protein